MAFSIVYAWRDKLRPLKVKFGDHFSDCENLELAYIDTERYIRNSLNREKYRYDTGEIEILFILDASVYAMSVNKFYKNAKLDIFIRNVILLEGNIQGDFYELQDEEGVVAFLNKIKDFLYQCGCIPETTKNETKKQLVHSFPQDYQIANIIDNVIANKNNDSIIYAEHCPRFGKTPVALSVFNYLADNGGANVLIIPAFVLSSLSSFRETISKYSNYHDLAIIDINDGIDVSDFESVFNFYYSLNKKIVILLSLHIRHNISDIIDEDAVQSQTDEDFYNELNNELGKLSYLKVIQQLPKEKKMVVVDEADYGAHTNRSQKVIDFFNAKIKYHMTGSAIEKVIGCSNQDYIFSQMSYTDLLEIKKGDHWLLSDLEKNENRNDTTMVNLVFKEYTKETAMKSVSNLVVPDFHQLNVPYIEELQKSLPIEDRFKWGKLFADCDKNEPIIDLLIKSTFKKESTIEYPKLHTLHFDSHAVTMLFVSTPTINQMDKFVNRCKLLLQDSHIVFGLHYKITNSREAEKKVKELLKQAKQEGKKLLIITKTIGSRSFSIPEIDSVYLWLDNGLAAAIIQKIARGYTFGFDYYGKPKLKCDIISYSIDPYRIELDPIEIWLQEEVSSRIYVNKNKEQQKVIKETIGCYNIFTNDNEGRTIAVDKDLLTERLLNGCKIENLFGSIIKNILDDCEMKRLAILFGNSVLSIPKATKKRSSLIGIKAYRKDKRNKRGERKESETKKQERLIREMLLKMVNFIPSIYTYTGHKLNTIEEMLSFINNDPILLEEVERDCAPIKLDWYKDVFMIGAINETFINTRTIPMVKNNIHIHHKYERHLRMIANKNLGEVLTLKALTKKIVNRIPITMIEDSSVRFLDPCAGSGTFGEALIERMAEFGISRKDALKRIYLNDCSTKWYNWLTKDRNGEQRFLNVSKKNALSESFSKWCEEMKFKVVLGNPPYQQADNNTKQWQKFVENLFPVLSKNGFMSLIVPSVWLFRDGRSFSKMRNIVEQNDLVESNTDLSLFFPDIGEKIGNFILRKSKTNIKSIIDGREEDLSKSLNDYIGELDYKIKKSIFDKLKNSAHSRLPLREDIHDYQNSWIEKGIISKTKTDEHIYPIYYTASQLQYSKELIGDGLAEKILINMSGYYYNPKTPDKHIFISTAMSGQGMYHILLNGMNAENIMSFLKSKLFRFFNDNTKTSGFNTTIYKLPWLGDGKFWTDAELYEHFGLTQEEVGYIETAISRNS